MDSEIEKFMFDYGLGGSGIDENWVPQTQSLPDSHFQPAVTQVANQFNGVGGYQNSLALHPLFQSGLYPQPANRVIKHVPKLTPQQQKKHYVWFEMVKKGSGFKECTPPFEWSEELHKKFMETVNELGGLDKAKPARILKKMCGYGLTRLTVKSHLQTCRRREKMAGTGSGRRESSMGRVEQDHVQNDVASESLVTNYSSGVENETVNNSLSPLMQFIWDELDREINEEEFLEFITPIYENHQE